MKRADGRYDKELEDSKKDCDSLSKVTLDLRLGRA